jgi:hypothetical protein
VVEVHAYVVIPEGPPVRFRVPPVQTGLLDVAVGTGIGAIATSTVLDAEHPFALVTVKVYGPPATAVTPVIDGF